jgi:hypothetical protein
VGDQITVNDTSIQISFTDGFQPATVFNGFVISEVGLNPNTITAVSLATTNTPGFDSSRISFKGTDVDVNLQDTADGSNNLSLDVTFGATAAPEPASLTLLGLGVAGLAAYGWRRRR